MKNEENRNGDKTVETAIDIKTPSGRIITVTSAIQLREVMRETFYLDIKNYDSFFRDFSAGAITFDTSLESLNAYGPKIIDNTLKRKIMELMKLETDHKRLKKDLGEHLKNMEEAPR